MAQMKCVKYSISLHDDNKQFIIYNSYFLRIKEKTFWTGVARLHSSRIQTADLRSCL